MSAIKLFRKALEMEIKAAGPDLKALRDIAGTLIDKAKGGNMEAIKIIAERLDGKPGVDDTAAGIGKITLNFITHEAPEPEKVVNGKTIEHESKPDAN